MTHTFIIAEAAVTWERDLEQAYRSIDAAKACGADAWKTQWTSSIERMAQRRGQASGEVYRRLLWPAEYHALLAAHCQKTGIEYMCTVFLPDDVAVIAPHVKRFKIAARECTDAEFTEAHHGRDVIMSRNKGQKVTAPIGWRHLHCVSRYPTALEDLGLECLRARRLYGNLHPNLPIYSDSLYHGLSDHATSLLTGALAVACGATIVEHHVRMYDTPPDNPDYPHSHSMEASFCRTAECDSPEFLPEFKVYCQNIREAERAMG